jgi:hypothetical protein
VIFIYKTIYRRLSKKALEQILEGRLRDQNDMRGRRFLHTEVMHIYSSAWEKVDVLLADAGLEKLPDVGNRHNVFLAVLSVALYQSLLETGVDKEYAIKLLADVGWKLYVKFLPLPKFIARIKERSPQKQMNAVLGLMLRFPFNAPGRPGYEVEAWAAEDGSFKTHWAFCPPLAFVQRYLRNHEDRGELEAFIGSWCRFDWAFANAILEGTGQPGWYQRRQTLSEGGAICDMHWAAIPPAPTENYQFDNGDNLKIES